MNRKSLLGPIVLILLGALLLAHNFWPEFSMFRLFGAYWPWILIGWGVFQLLEFGVAVVRQRPTPSPLGGGAFVLALLIVIVGSIAHSTEYGWRFRRWDRLFLHLPAPANDGTHRVRAGWPVAPTPPPVLPR